MPELPPVGGHGHADRRAPHTAWAGRTRYGSEPRRDEVGPGRNGKRLCRTCDASSRKNPGSKGLERSWREEAGPRRENRARVSGGARTVCASSVSIYTILNTDCNRKITARSKKSRPRVRAIRNRRSYGVLGLPSPLSESQGLFAHPRAPVPRYAPP
jgi:hypothetical protein